MLPDAGLRPAQRSGLPRGWSRRGEQVARSRAGGNGDVGEAGSARAVGQARAGGEDARAVQPRQRLARQRREQRIQRFATAQGQ